MSGGKRTNRGPAELRYKAEQRWVKNKARSIARDHRRKAKDAASPKKRRVRETFKMRERERKAGLGPRKARLS